MFRTNRIPGITAVIATTLFLITSLSFAEPHRLLGDNGAYFWSMSQPVNHGFVSIDDGRKVISTWSEKRASDGLRQIYRQIFDGDGNTTFNPPQLLSDPRYRTMLGASCTDEAGFYYVAWLSFSDENPTVAWLYAQKFDADGRELWGRQAGVIANVQVNPTEEYMYLGHHTTQKVIPNDQGGCYYLSCYGYFALDEDGELRQNWPWHNLQFGPDSLLQGAFSDDSGGFWVTERILGDQHIGFNHYYANGDRLTDEFGQFQPGGFDGIALIRFGAIFGYQGGIVAVVELYGALQLMTFDSEGNCGEDQRSFTLSQDAPYYFYSMQRISNQRLILSWSRNNHSECGVWFLDLESFTPTTDDLIMLKHDDRDNQILFEPGKALAVSENELIIPLTYCDLEGTYRNEFHKLNWNGEFVWREPRGGNIGFEYGAELVKGNGAGMFLVESNRNDMNYLTSEGEIVHQSSKHFGAYPRDYPNPVIMWERPWSGYGALVLNGRRSLNYLSFDRNGESIGGPIGRVIKQVNYRGDESFATTRLENRIFYAVNVFDELRRKWSISIGEIDLSGNVRWETVPDQQSNDSYRNLGLSLSPDNSRLILSGVTNSAVVIAFVASIAPDNGNILWNRNWSWDRGDERHAEVIPTANGIYLVSIVSSRYFMIDILDYAGNDIREEPLTIFSDHDPEFIGAAPLADNEDGIWIGLNKDGPNDREYFWAHKVVGEEVTDSVSFFSEGVDLYIPREEEMDILLSGNIVWLVPSCDEPDGSYIDTASVIPIQGIRPDGSLLYGEEGLKLDVGQDNYISGITAMPTASGSIYLAWSQGGQSRATMLDPSGEFREGWNASGNVVAEGNVSSNRFACSWGDDELGLVFHAGSNYDQRFCFQHISNSPRQSASDEALPAPASFDLTSVSPNPFNGMTRLNYRLEGAATLKMRLFNLQGMTVWEESFERGSGAGSIALDMSAYPTGLYFARLEAAGVVRTTSLLLLK